MRCLAMSLALLLAGSVVVSAAPERPLRVCLFDFENGVAGWSGNPWGGGKCGAEAAGDAAFGKQCLRGWYTGVKRGANIISPYFPDNASWRKDPWDGISLMFKGDGSAGKVRLQLEAAEKKNATYSRSISLENTAWHRVYLPFHTFWNRGGKPFNVARFRRFYFGADGTHHFFVDNITLEAPHRRISLTAVPTVAIPLTSVPPTIDGRLDDPCWRTAAKIDSFSLIDGSAKPKEQTECRLLRDGNTLYIAATLQAANPSRLKASLTRRDSPVYEDDSFEVFLTGSDPNIRFYQFAVNPLGTQMDLSSPGLLSFNHEWTVKTGRLPHAWTVEMALPLTPMIGHPGPGTMFGLNLCREDRETKELSCWSPTGNSFLRPGRFGQAVLLGDTPLLPMPAPEWDDYGNGRYGALLDASSLKTGAVLRAQVLFGTQRFSGKAEADASGIHRHELLAPVDTAIKTEGDAEVRFLLTERDGRPLSFHAFRYHIFLPLKTNEAPSPLPVVPSPKEVTMTKGVFSLPAHPRIAAVGPQQIDVRVTDFIRSQLVRWFAAKPAFTAAAANATMLLYKHPKGGTVPASLGLSAALAKRVPGLKPEGYVLDVTPSRAVIAANDDAGLYYGAQTLLQCMEADTRRPASPRVSCCTVVDWPSLPVRALSMPVPTNRWGYPNDAPVDCDFFCRFIERFVARHKFNKIVFIVQQAVRYDSHPEISSPVAWTKPQLRRVIDVCRANFIEPIPLTESYGHAAWMTLSHKNLWEDGDHNIMCTRNPETFKILTDVDAELIKLFAPTHYFHIGMDEVRWRTLDVPKSKRCKLCAGIPKWILFANQVKRLHDWLAKRHVRTIMWGDQLLPEHNGGAPYHSARALPLIPKDVIIANWSTSLAPDSNRRFQKAGYTVWQSNSRGVNRAQRQYVQGNMFGVWNKISWWGDAPWRSGQAYSYLNFPIAAEYSWNLWPRLKTMQPPLSWSWLRQREKATVDTDGLQPVPHAGAEEFSVPIPANLSTKASDPSTPAHWFDARPAADLRNLPRGDVKVGGVTFRISAAESDCAAPLPPGKGNVVIPVKRKAASLRFLQTARIDPKQEHGFFEQFKKGANWRGVPVGTYVIRYADGTTSTLPILYMNNIKSWKIGGRIPYVFRSVGFLYAATDAMKKQSPNARDICLYVAQWVNPHPQETIASVTLTGSRAVTPVLFAITGRNVRQDTGK